MDQNELPFMAPCRQLQLLAPFRWLQLGWRDLCAAKTESLFFGSIAVISSYAVSAVAWHYGSLGLLLGVLTGFVFLGPLLALTLYSISDQLAHSESPALRRSFADAARAAGDALVFAIVLLVIFLVWARAASMVHVFFPADSGTAGDGLGVFLAVGTAVGAVFSVIVFTASAFSLPMLIDRKTDAVTAIVTSVNAVLRNKPAMLVWSALIVLLTLVGFATAFLGFVLLLPLMGYATWHGYQETIDASSWPEQERWGEELA